MNIVSVLFGRERVPTAGAAPNPQPEGQVMTRSISEEATNVTGGLSWKMRAALAVGAGVPLGVLAVTNPAAANTKGPAEEEAGSAGPTISPDRESIYDTFKVDASNMARIEVDGNADATTLLETEGLTYSGYPGKDGLVQQVSGQVYDTGYELEGLQTAGPDGGVAGSFTLTSPDNKFWVETSSEGPKTSVRVSDSQEEGEDDYFEATAEPDVLRLEAVEGSQTGRVVVDRHFVQTGEPNIYESVRPKTVEEAKLGTVFLPDAFAEEQFVSSLQPVDGDRVDMQLWADADRATSRAAAGFTLNGAEITFMADASRRFSDKHIINEVGFFGIEDGEAPSSGQTQASLSRAGEVYEATSALGQSGDTLHSTLGLEPDGTQEAILSVTSLSSGGSNLSRLSVDPDKEVKAHRFLEDPVVYSQGLISDRWRQVRP